VGTATKPRRKTAPSPLTSRMQPPPFGCWGMARRLSSSCWPSSWPLAFNSSTRPPVAAVGAARGRHWDSHWPADCASPTSHESHTRCRDKKCIEVSTLRGRRCVGGMGSGRCRGAGGVSPASGSHRAQGGVCVRPANAVGSVARLRVGLIGVAGTGGGVALRLGQRRGNRTQSQQSELGVK